MAGKTLPGIGDEDESGEREGTPGGGTPTASNTPARSTDRMPMYSGPTVIDEDKVAEGLKKLRSLDEPLGPVTSAIPPGTPTLKEGVAVGYTPTPVTPAVPSALELLRSRGTAHGHALSTPAVGQGLVPMAVDDRMKGTLLGHSLHLPDLPEVVEENRTADVRSIDRVASSGRLTPGEMHTDFSHGDARFFESDPLNTEFEPEHPKTNLMRRGVIFVAIMSIFVVAAIAYVGVRKPDKAPSLPVETQEVPATHAPEATPPTTTIPSSAAVADNPAIPVGSAAPTSAAAAPAPVVPAPAATPAEQVQEEAKPDPAAAALRNESPSAKLQREAAEAEAIKAAKPASRSGSVRPSRNAAANAAANTSSNAASAARAGRTPSVAPSGHQNVSAKPAPAGRHAKVEDDPDGTLPLSD
jgi:hypothetical protein